MKFPQINNTTALLPSHSAEAALATMAMAQLAAMPVADKNGIFLGIVTLDALLQHKKSTKIKEVNLEKNTVFVPEDASILEILKWFEAEKLDILPVLSPENQYKGIITTKNILEYYAEFMQNAASLLVLETYASHYALSEVVRLAEANNCQILSLHTTTPTGSPELLHINITFAQPELTALVATYERFEYSIIYKQHRSDRSDLYQDRYDALMSYLNV